MTESNSHNSYDPERINGHLGPLGLCMEVHGAFVHHRPLDSELIAKNAGEVIGYTKGRLFDAYGALVPWIWGGTNAVCYYTSQCDQGIYYPASELP